MLAGLGGDWKRYINDWCKASLNLPGQQNIHLWISQSFQSLVIKFDLEDHVTWREGMKSVEWEDDNIVQYPIENEKLSNWRGNLGDSWRRLIWLQWLFAGIGLVLIQYEVTMTSWGHEGDFFDTFLPLLQFSYSLAN